MDPNELFAQMFSQMGGMGGGFGPGVRVSGFGPGMAGGAVDINEIFGQMFGGGGGGGGRGGGGQRMMTLRKVEVSLEELYAGGTRTERHNGKPFTLRIQPGWKAGTKLKFEDDGVSSILST